MKRLRVKKATFGYIDEVYDPMNTRNNVVPRAFVETAVLCSVMCGDVIKAVEEQKAFNAADYARQAFAKYGKCRVMFYQPGDGRTWREIRWKNSNVGTLYRRPSFMNVENEDVPPELQVAMLCVS